ncbi:hypothetical protein H5410_059227 [Solanum commersonii]|uniref:Uncharacterized protein n=1 Tax=Solanum commersonii TaxID=4109 RepID=A0A9J5W1U7_SOLCO|nr:hypothetical protein H5410_059227 [Solanum commersonii]
MVEKDRIHSGTVMNQVQLNVDIKVTQVVIGLTRVIGSRMSNRARLSETNKGKRGIVPLNTNHIRKCDILFGTDQKGNDAA